MIRVRSIEEAKRSKESQSAEQDPDGHWGEITNGLQMSLRFEKGEYRVGEPLTAVVLLRNVENVQLKFLMQYVSGRPSPVNILVTEGGKELALKSQKSAAEFDVVDTSTKSSTLYPQTQLKYVMDLRAYYDFREAADYSCKASCKFADSEGQHEMHSGSVRIAVTNRP